MTYALAGALGAAVLIVAGIVGLALSIGPRTDEGGPVFDDRMTPTRIAVAIAAGLLVLAGAALFGVTST